MPLLSAEFNPYQFDSKGTKTVRYKGNGNVFTRYKDQRGSDAPQEGDYVGIAGAPFGPQTVDHLAVVMNRKKDVTDGSLYTLLIIRTSRTKPNWLGHEERPESEWEDYTVKENCSGSYVWPLSDMGREELLHHFENIDETRKEEAFRQFRKKKETDKANLRFYNRVYRLKNSRKRSTLLKNTENGKRVFNVSTGKCLTEKTRKRRRLPVAEDADGGEGIIPLTCNPKDKELLLKIKRKLYYQYQGTTGVYFGRVHVDKKGERCVDSNDTSENGTLKDEYDSDGVYRIYSTLK